MAKVGLFLNSTADYHSRIVAEVKDSARDGGIGVEVFDSQNTAAKQAQDLIRFARDNAAGQACALVVPQHDSSGGAAVESDPTFRLARRVLGIGVGWITINHGREEIIATLRAEFPKLPVAIVTVDNVEFGRVQARQVRMILPRGGAVLLVRGDPSDSACLDRLTGLKEGLDNSSIALEEIDGQWESHVAGPAVHRWLMSPLRSKKALGAIVCQNDHMGLGARQALDRAVDELKRPDLKQVPILGGDGLPEFGLRWVKDHTLTSTISVALPARPVIEQLLRFWQSASPMPPVTRLPVTSIPSLAELRPASP